MARQNMTVAATVATSPVLSVGFIMPTPGAYTLYKYIRAHACDSFTHDRWRCNEIFLTLKPWKISKMTAEIVTNLDFLAPAYKKMAEIIAQLLKKV